MPKFVPPKTDLTKIDSTKTDLTKTDLTKTDLTKTDLTKIDSTKTDLTKIDLTGGVALVLSGGGSKGDFELGAIRYLYEVENIAPTLLAGTSVGALNVAKLAEGEVSPYSGLKGLLKIWLTLDRNSDMWNFEYWVSKNPLISGFLNDNFVNVFIGSDMFKLLPSGGINAGDVGNFFVYTVNPATPIILASFLLNGAYNIDGIIEGVTQSSSVANLDPIRNKVYGRDRSNLFNPSLITQWAAGGKRKLRIGTVSLDSGNMRFISETGQMLDRYGKKQVLDKNNQPISCNLSEAVIASCSIGAVFPPVNIGDEYYVDGGHRNNIPADPIYDPAINITTAYIVSSSIIGLSPENFGTTNTGPNVVDLTTQTNRTIFGIVPRCFLDTFVDETAYDAIAPRGGWGTRNVITISPSTQLHELTYVDPGMIRISSDYGWMRADDAVNGRGPDTRLFQISDEISDLRVKLWIIEGRYLDIFRDMEKSATNKSQFLNNMYPFLSNYRRQLNGLISERKNLGGKMPPLAERWAQTGEAHSTGFGDLPIKDLQVSDNPSSIASSMTSDGDVIYYTLDSFGYPVIDPDTGVETIDFNHPRRIVFSTYHQEPFLATGVMGWRTVGRCRLVAGTLLSCIQTVDRITALFAVDCDGNIIRAELLPDEMGFAGWLPVSEGGKAKPGGWVTGVSHRPGSLSIFIVGMDQKPYVSTRNADDPQWTAWSPLPNDGSFPLGAPLSAVSRSLNLIDIFGSDVGGNILQASLNPTNPLGLSWSPINGGMTSPGGCIAAVSCNVDEIDLFVIGTDGAIYHSFSSSTTPFTMWTKLPHDSTFNLDGYISAVSPAPGKIDVVAIDVQGRVVTTMFDTPSRSFNGFMQIGSRTFDAGGRVSLIAQTDTGASRASCFGADGVLYDSINGHNPNSWSDWDPISSYAGSPVAIPPPTAFPFVGTMDYTFGSAAPDLINMRVYEDVVPSDQVNFVLESGPGIRWHKEIVIREGSSSGTGAWPITTYNDKKFDQNSLYIPQLSGGTLEFMKLNSGSSALQSLLTISIDNIKPGSRIVFTWVKDA